MKVLHRGDFRGGTKEGGVLGSLFLVFLTYGGLLVNLYMVDFRLYLFMADFLEDSPLGGLW